MIAALMEYSGNVKDALNTGSFHFDPALMDAMIKLSIYARDSGVTELILSM